VWQLPFGGRFQPLGKLDLGKRAKALVSFSLLLVWARRTDLAVAELGIGLEREDGAV